MNHSQPPKQTNFNNLQSTHIPNYASNHPNHPNQMRLYGPYGETAIPATAFLSKINNSSISSPHRPSDQFGGNFQNNNQYNYAPNRSQINYQQMHHPLPLYTYGNQCQPCGQQSYMLPVYYEEPIRVRQQWQRPLDSNIHQQEWRFVKTQDNGGVVKYVTKNQKLVETLQQSRWKQYYSPKNQTNPPMILPERQTKTCCSPLLFALFGFIALIGLILGLVLLLSGHQMNFPKDTYRPNVTYVDPTPGKVNQQILPVPVEPQSVNQTKVLPITRPTFTESITSKPLQSVQTKDPVVLTSRVQKVNAQPVSVSYGYRSDWEKIGSINQENDYQIRPSEFGQYRFETINSEHKVSGYRIKETE